MNKVNEQSGDRLMDTERQTDSCQKRGLRGSVKKVKGLSNEKKKTSQTQMTVQ